MNLKKILYSFMAVLFSGIAWYFFSLVTAGHGIFGANVGNIIGFVLTIALSYAFIFVVALTRDRLDFFLTTLLSALWILVFLGTNVQTAVSALVLFLATQVLMEFPSSLQKSIDLHYFRTAYMKSALVVLVLIGISAGYIQQHLTQKVQEQGFSEKTSVAVWPLLRSFTSQFNSDQTVDQFLTEQFQEQGVDKPQGYMLTQEKQRLSKQFGFQINGSEKMSDLGKTFLAHQLNDFIKRFNFNRTGLYIIFFSLLILWPFGRFFLAIIAAGVYWMLRQAGWAKVAESQIIAKRLEV